MEKGTRPVASPKDISDITAYHNEQTHELKGYIVSITTEDNCWPGILFPNPFRLPSPDNAYIASFRWIDYNTNVPPYSAIEITYVFPTIIRKYVFPRIKLFGYNVKQNAYRHAADFRMEMLKQIVKKK